MASAHAVSLWRLLLPLLPGDCAVALTGAGASAAGTPLNGDWSTGVTVGGPVTTQHSDNLSGNWLNCSPAVLHPCNAQRGMQAVWCHVTETAVLPG